MLTNLECACASLRRASRVVTNLYTTEMRTLGMESTQFTVLMAINLARPIKQAGLAEILGVDSTSLTRALRPLVRDGFIEVRRGTDRREKWLSLTPAGKKTYRQYLPHWQRAQAKLKAALTETGWDNLFQALNKATLAAIEAQRG